MKSLIPLLRLAPLASFLSAAAMSLISSLCAIVLMGASAYIISSAALLPPLSSLALAITLVRAAGLFRAAFRYLDRWLSHRATFRLLTRLRLVVYRLAETLLPLKAPGTSEGALLAHLTEGVSILRDFYLRVLAPPLLTLSLAALACLILWPLSPAAAGLVLLAWLLALLLPLSVRTIRGNADEGAAAAECRSTMLDGLAGLQDLQGAAKKDAPDLSCRSFRLRLSACGSHLMQEWKRRARLGQIEDLIVRAALAVLFVLLFALLIPLVQKNLLTGIGLAVCLLALQTVFAEFYVLPEAMRTLARTRKAARFLLASPAEVGAIVGKGSMAAEKTDLNAKARQEKKRSLPSAPDAAALRRENVSLLAAKDIAFSYEGQPPLFSHLSFTLEEGEHLAIIGESGCGKTTLFHLLLRLWETDSGSFFLRGRPYASLSPEETRAHFAASTQGIRLFAASVRENFAHFLPEADEASIWQALETACLAAEIREWGLDTSIGADGANLSGGQRQRLLLALALAAPAPLVLLDEPTAGLDVHTADKVMQAVRRALRGRSLLLITHDRRICRGMRELRLGTVPTELSCEGLSPQECPT
ncbi:ATP-binding cassette domain-containing protein [Selenomonas sputigena]|uniref:ATP-binding cassette domain-containing protein n=1 Tax=Selenomonas sputigena TaxID=69823 RepID=A0ABV3X379_9FIRM